MAASVKKTAIYTLFASFMMFAFCFAMVPLYNAYCKTTGINTASRITSPADLTRTITVQFIATNNQELPWEFYPRSTTVTVHPNENATIFFHAKNTTQNTMTVQAIPDFTPQQSARHFFKVECFCFTKQTLMAGESREMPVIFHIDDSLPKDVNTITLAYTLFDVSKHT